MTVKKRPRAMNKRMSKDWIWLPHPAHFILGGRCKFHLATDVGGIIVSTVGELPHDSVSRKYRYKGSVETDDWQEIGCGRLYETMVFRSRAAKMPTCCPREINVSRELETKGYTAAEDAYSGHLQLCKKWGKR